MHGPHTDKTITNTIMLPVKNAVLLQCETACYVLHALPLFSRSLLLFLMRPGTATRIATRMAIPLYGPGPTSLLRPHGNTYTPTS